MSEKIPPFLEGVFFKKLKQKSLLNALALYKYKEKTAIVVREGQRYLLRVSGRFRHRTGTIKWNIGGVKV